MNNPRIERLGIGLLKVRFLADNASDCKGLAY